MKQMVKMYDFETQKEVKIPSIELAIGMAFGRSEDGVESWIDLSQIKSDDSYIHPPLTEEMLNRIRTVKALLQEVDNKSLESWARNFRKEYDPHREMLIWEWIAYVYQESTKNQNMTIGRKKEYFDLIHTCSFTPMGKSDCIMDFGCAKSFPKNEAKKVINLFYSYLKGISHE